MASSLGKLFNYRMAMNSSSSTEGSTAPPPTPNSINQGARGDLAYELRPYLQAARQELESTLLSYREVLPDSLILMVRFALSGELTLLSIPEPLENLNISTVASWPLYVLLSCKAALEPENRETWRRALSAAVAVEIAMAAASLLDELADDDPSPFVRKYGPGQASNTGNLMLVMAQQILQRNAQGEGGQGAMRALGALQDMLTQAALGQHLDMLYERMGAGEVTLDMSIQMAELKTGALVSGACRIGALMAGAEGRIVELLARFGKENGCIAQLINDIQDVIPQYYQSEADGGAEADEMPERKTDLRLRKRTLPIVFTLREDVPYPNALQRAFAGDSTPDVDEEELRRAVIDAGGVQFANLIAEVHRQNAIEAINELEALRPGAREALRPLVSQE